MSQHKPKKPSGQGQMSVAVGDLIDRDSDYDTSTVAWAKFDRRLTKQIAQFEQQLHRYFTPAASRKELGR